MIILDEESKIRDADDIDEIVSAEIPDKEKFPRLYKTVTNHMLHGPCGAHNMHCPCMVEDPKTGKSLCSKKFPKEFRKETSMGEDSYALYKRRDNGSTFETKKGVIMDNRWVVPYNPYLCLLFDAHINVEICATVKSVKYLYKYCYKGPDRARMMITVNGNDEIVHDEVKHYVALRYLS